MSTGTTLVDELERAAERADFAALQCTPQAVGVRWKYLRGIREAEAVRLRQRAAWVREMEQRINAGAGIVVDLGGFVRMLTGPDIPAETAPTAEPGKPATPMPSLINQLMMGADAWAQLANQNLPGLSHAASQALYEERSLRARQYRERAERIRYWIARAKAFRDNPNVPLEDMSGPMVVSMLEIICGEVPSEPAGEPGKPATCGGQCVKHGDEMHSVHEYEPGVAARWALQDNIGRCPYVVPPTPGKVGRR